MPKKAFAAVALQWAESRLRAFPKPLYWYNWSGSCRVHRVPAFKQACCIAIACKCLFSSNISEESFSAVLQRMENKILRYVIGPSFIKMQVGSCSHTRVYLCISFTLFRRILAGTGAAGNQLFVYVNITVRNQCAESSCNHVVKFSRRL